MVISSEVLFWLAFFAGINILAFLASVGVCFLEKHPLPPYADPAVGEEYTRSSEAEEANQDAKKIGYRHIGLCHGIERRLHRMRYDYWIAPDGVTIALIGSGKVLLMPISGVWLYSRTQGGEILCTTNEPSNQDVSGVLQQKTWPNERLIPLTKKHESRLNGVFIQPFSESQPIADYFEILRFQVDGMIKKGFAYYLDDKQTLWRYSLKGSVTSYLVSVWGRPIARLLRSMKVLRK
jgi:hypothetical protein